MTMAGTKCAVAALLLLTAACGDVVHPPVPPRLVELRMDTATVLLEVGETVRLTAVPLDEFVAPLTVGVQWTSRSPSIVSVDSTGVVRGQAVGTTWIVASATHRAVTVSDSARVLVHPPLVEESVIGVLPVAATLAVGEALTFRGHGIGFHRGEFTWSVEDATVASIEATSTISTSESRATVRALQPGTTTLILRSERGGTALASLTVR